MKKCMTRCMKWDLEYKRLKRSKFYDKKTMKRVIELEKLMVKNNCEY